MSSPYLILALKHRPMTFAEVIGQDHVTRTLKHSLERKQIANAYLFTGSRGTGKTTTARILAKALNCEQPIGAEPCNLCDSCRAIINGTHIDVLEIDAASNRGIDEIQALRDNVRFTPSLGKYKVYIIDEVHMLTKEANNALLKTLEEPPSYSKFILATTELHKIMPTILSRCQRFQFRRIPSQIIVDHLKKILAKQEGIELTEPSELELILYQIARTSEGGLRDALVTLDQLLAFCVGKLTLAEVEELLGVIEFDLLDRFMRAVMHHELEKIFLIIEEILDRGREISWFLSECLTFLRNLAVTKVSPNNPALLDLPEDYTKQIQNTAAETTLEQILYITDVFWEAERRMRFSSEARLIMEMAAIKAAKAGQAVKVKDLLEKITSLSTSSISNRPIVMEPSLPLLVSSPEPATKDKALQSEERESDPIPQPEPKKEKVINLRPTLPEKMPTPTEPSAKPSAEETHPISVADNTNMLTTGWQQLLREIEHSSPILAAALHHTTPLEITNNTLHVGIPSRYSYNKRTLEQIRNRDTLNRLVKESFGQSLSVHFEVRKDLKIAPEEKSLSAEMNTPPKFSQNELREKVQKDKMFLKIMEELPGRILTIQPERE